MKKKLSVRLLVRLALFTGLALVLFVVEAQIPLPVPLPGFKLGLSNVVTLFILFWDGPLAALAVLLVRIGLGTVVTGQVSALFYSLAGGLLSLGCGILLKRFLTDRQLWVAGVVCGLAHNVGQVLVGMLITKTPSLLWYLPFLAAVGMVNGLFTGLIATLVLRQVKKIEKTKKS